MKTPSEIVRDAVLHLSHALPAVQRDAMLACADGFDEAEQIKAARERLHAKFGYVKGPDDKCACAYCVRDAEALGEMCAEYEMRVLSLEQKLVSLPSPAPAQTDVQQANDGASLLPVDPPASPASTEALTDPEVIEREGGSNPLQHLYDNPKWVENYWRGLEGEFARLTRRTLARMLVNALQQRGSGTDSSDAKRAEERAGAQRHNSTLTGDAQPLSSTVEQAKERLREAIELYGLTPDTAPYLLDRGDDVDSAIDALIAAVQSVAHDGRQEEQKELLRERTSATEGDGVSVSVPASALPHAVGSLGHVLSVAAYHTCDLDHFATARNVVKGLEAGWLLLVSRANAEAALNDARVWGQWHEAKGANSPEAKELQARARVTIGLEAGSGVPSHPPTGDQA